MTKILSFVLVAFAAFFFTMSFSGFIAPWDYDVSGRTWAEYHKAIDFYMGARMPIISLSCTASMVFFLILERKNWKEKPFRFMALAILIQVLLIIIAVNTNVAMNAEMNNWNPENLPSNWATMRDQWLHYHHFNAPFNLAFSTCIFLACYFYWTKNKNN